MRARGRMDRGGVKAAPFEYLRAGSVDEAISALAADDGAKIIAGGQSLVPLMVMRLARPTLLVDVNDLGLDTVAVVNDEVRIGAGVPHSTLERDPVIARAAPLLADAAVLIGYPAIRVRGTIGGSAAHADPVAELPAVLVALGAIFVAHGAAGAREVAAADFFEGFLTTTLAPDEVLVEVRVPEAGPRVGAAFCEWAPRAGDFAVAGVGVQIERAVGGACVSVRGAACGAGAVPLDCSEMLSAALGEVDPPDALLRDVARGFGEHELLGLLAARALHRAFARAEWDAAA
jgi:aerobic carbon-monoxide dehydrogenase medium subunit